MPQPAKRWRERVEGDVWPRGIAWQLRNRGLVVNVRWWVVRGQLWFRLRLDPQPDAGGFDHVRLGMKRVRAKGGWRWRRLACWLGTHVWSDFEQPTFERKTYLRTCDRCGRAEGWVYLEPGEGGRR